MRGLTLQHRNYQGVADTPAQRSREDDLDRNVFGIFGVPIDAIDLPRALSEIDRAIDQRKTLFISTPNVNFLVMSRDDGRFREALLESDLCPPDGMPIIWMARLLNIPIMQRVAGSDIFRALRSRDENSRGLNTFLFGGADGMARIVAEKMNARPWGMRCVGAMSPGFGSVDEMSREEIIGTINNSHADFLAVFLSAKKAQEWLLQNHNRLDVPVRAQFGTTINFEAGKVKRAPPAVRAMGLEWLWRIKEEPYLWRRYWRDGRELAVLLCTCAIPLMGGVIMRSFRPRDLDLDFDTYVSRRTGNLVVKLKGDAVEQFINSGIDTFRAVLDEDRDVEIDLSDIKTLDQRYLGLFLMVRKNLRRGGRSLTFSEVPAKVKRYFTLNRFEYLLAPADRRRVLPH